MKDKAIKLSTLKPNDHNPRTIKDEAFQRLCDSIKRDPQFMELRPIVIDEGNIILGGNQRYRACQHLGMMEVPASWVKTATGLTPEQRKRFVVVDNAPEGMAGEWDFDILAADWELPELGELGFEKLLKDIEAAMPAEPVDAEPQVDRAEELREQWGVQTGQLWTLGDHRLLCGDSTSEVDFAKLMNGRKAQMTVTSPPYGVGKDYETKGIEPWFETMRPVVKNLTRYSGIVCWNLGDLYSTGTQFIEPTNFYSSQLFSEQGFRPIWIRIWKKQGMNFGVGPYHLVTNKPVQQYEYISAFSKNGDVEYNDQEYVWLSAYAGHAYRFVKRLTKEERKNWGYAGIWEMTTVRANKDHPAMYPVELPWRCIKMHSDRGDIILEPFSGSGTTIIACEQLGRKCRAIEISAGYVAVALQRWADATGKTPVLCTANAESEALT